MLLCLVHRLCVPGGGAPLGKAPFLSGRRSARPDLVSHGVCVHQPLDSHSNGVDCCCDDRMRIAVEEAAMQPCRDMHPADWEGVRPELRDDEVLLGSRRAAVAALSRYPGLPPNGAGPMASPQ